MSAQSRKHSAATFLEPGTVLSSRASIFGDDSNQEERFHIHKSKRSRSGLKSNRPGQDDFENESEEDDAQDPEEAYSKAVLERLYGKLAGEIEINDDATQDAKTKSSSSLHDTRSKKLNQGSREDNGEAEEEEEQVMEFRLFASTDNNDDTPTSLVVLNPKAPVEIYVHHEREELDESPESERMRQIIASAIDAKTVLDQASIPWARTFFAHKVIHVPFKEKEPSKEPTRKSKRKREFEKKVKAGLISAADLEATARKVKVSESYGHTPFIMRKGLDRNTIDPGTATAGTGDGGGGRGRGRGRGRGGARGGRGGDRGSSRGGARGGRGGGRGGASITSTTSSARKGDIPSDADGGTRDSSTAPGSADQTAAAAKPLKKKPKTKDAPTATKAAAAAPVSTPVSKSAPGITTDSSAPQTIPTKKSKKDSLPPKEPKTKKPASKIDNIMAMLMGK